MHTSGGPPHPVIVTIRDNRDYIGVLLYSYYTTITGWVVLLMHARDPAVPCLQTHRSCSGGWTFYRRLAAPHASAMVLL